MALFSNLESDKKDLRKMLSLNNFIETKFFLYQQ